MTSDSVHRFVVAYDIKQDSRRNRVAKTLESFGDRIQYSVFLVDAKPAKLVRLRAAVAALIDLATDSVLLCDLGPLKSSGRSRIQSVGQERSYTSQGPLVL